MIKGRIQWKYLFEKQRRMTKLNPALENKVWEEMKSINFLDLSLYFCFINRIHPVV